MMSTSYPSPCGKQTIRRVERLPVVPRRDGRPADRARESHQNVVIRRQSITETRGSERCSGHTDDDTINDDDDHDDDELEGE